MTNPWIWAALTVSCVAGWPATAVATVRAPAPPVMSDCDGQFGPELFEGFERVTSVAWSLMGTGQDGRSLLIGTRLGLKPDGLCVRVVRADSEIVRLEVWSPNRFSTCSRDETGVSCDALDEGIDYSEPPHPYAIPVHRRVDGQRVLGGRRSRAFRAAGENDAPYSYYRRLTKGARGQAFAVPRLVGLRSADAEDILRGIGADTAGLSPRRSGIVDVQLPMPSGRQHPVSLLKRPGLILR